MITLSAIRTGELWELSRVSLCHHGSILFTQDVDTKSYFPTFIPFYWNIFLKYPLHLRLADEEENGLILFSLDGEFPAGLTNNSNILYIIVERFAIRRWEMITFRVWPSAQINNEMCHSWICVKDCGQRVVVLSGKKVGELDREMWPSLLVDNEETSRPENCYQ